jgi:hypothetical protein
MSSGTIRNLPIVSIHSGPSATEGLLRTKTSMGSISVKVERELFSRIRSSGARKYQRLVNYSAFFFYFANFPSSFNRR